MNAVAQLRFHTLHVPFRQRFQHASADRSVTSSVWVVASGPDGLTGSGESCPRPYVTGETLESAKAFFDAVCDDVLAYVCDAGSLRTWVAEHAARIDRNPAAWCAIELALIDLFARQAGQTAEAWLGLPASDGLFHYTAVLGDGDLAAFTATFARYRENGMTDFKVKLAGDLARDREKLSVLRDAGPAVARLRLDANNLWPDAASAGAYLTALNAPAFAIEEPLVTSQYAQLPVLAKESGLAVILDESLCRLEELARFEPGTTWIPNLRISKMGGLLRTLAIVDAAKAKNLSLIVGAQVGETSLLTRVALIAARAADNNLLAQEGAYGRFLLDGDACEPSLMFSHGGVLQFESAGPGWGLACAPQQAWLRSD